MNLREEIAQAASKFDGHVTNGSLNEIMAVVDRLVREARSQRKEYIDIMEYVRDFKEMPKEKFAEINGADAWEAFNELVREAKEPAVGLAKSCIGDCVDELPHAQIQRKLWKLVEILRLPLVASPKGDK